MRKGWLRLSDIEIVSLADLHNFIDVKNQPLIQEMVRRWNSESKAVEVAEIHGIPFLRTLGHYTDNRTFFPSLDHYFFPSLLGHLFSEI